MLSPERWRIVSPYLDQVLALPPEERGAWIESLREKDAQLADELASLLAAHSQLDSAGFLEGSGAQRPAPSSLAGLVVGAYTLRSPLGQGGMGSVWLADRSDGRFTGQSAVKLLNPSLIGRESEGRFKREGSFLARVRHAHIAQLIDAGVTPHGQPFLVLEYVDGERIDRHCDTNRLGVEARVRLFLDVLSAVAFAHANLVVHRDIKPPNILVGNDGAVKLLDFGIAKLLESDGAGGGAMTMTREGSAALTPEYAAPEQLTGGSITTATDVYALGIVLYVLLTGRHPTASGGSSPSDWIKDVIETEPTRPSESVVTDESAAQRATSPDRLRRSLKGDLDNIVAKALKKKPEERYPSVDALADDLRRYLNHEPVAARADSFAYRAAKFVRRHRGGVLAAVLVLAALLAGTAGISWQARKARIQRDAARTQLARANATNEFTTFLLSVASPDGGKFSVFELLANGEAAIDKQYAKNDAMLADLLVAVGEQYLEAQNLDKAGPILKRARDAAARSGDPALEARASCTLALFLVMNHERLDAEKLLSHAFAILPEGELYAPLHAECLLVRSQFGFFTNEADAMRRDAAAVIDLVDRTPNSSPVVRVDALSALAHAYQMNREFRKADETYAQCMKALEAMGRDRTLVAADTLNNWGLLHFRGDLSKAEALTRRVLELHRSIEGSSVKPGATSNYAGVLLRLRRYPESAALYEESIRSAVARNDVRAQMDNMIQLGLVYIECGELQRGSDQLDKLAPFKKLPAFGTYRQAQLAFARGRLARKRGDSAGAKARFLDAKAIYDALPNKIALTNDTLIELAYLELDQGELSAARATADQALAMAQSFVDINGPSFLVGLSLLARGDIERAQGAAETARASYRAAAEHLRTTLGADHPSTQEALRKAAS